MNKQHRLSALIAARTYLTFISATVFLFSITYGQIPVDELRRKMKESAKKSEEEFYKQPPTIRVSFFINDVEVPLKEDARFSMLSGGNEIKPVSTDGDKFLFPMIKEDFGVELMTTELKEQGNPLRFNDIKPTFVEHGAQMIFGLITDSKLLKMQPRLDGCPYAYCDARRTISQNKSMKHLKINKNTVGIAFFVLLPTVWGEGIMSVSAYGIPKTKKKK